WLIKIQIDRKMASNETIMVSRLKGKGSKGRSRQTHPVLIATHLANQTRGARAKGAVPAARVTARAIRWERPRARICSSSSLAICATFRLTAGALVSSAWSTRSEDRTGEFLLKQCVSLLMPTYHASGMPFESDGAATGLHAQLATPLERLFFRAAGSGLHGNSSGAGTGGRGQEGTASVRRQE